MSISRGFSDLNDDGVRAFLAAIERAKAAGIFVITTSTYQYSADFMDPSTDFGGLGKADYFGEPDELSTYTLGTWEQNYPESFAGKLLVPMDARTTADFTGEENYVFYTDGGWSWVAPWLAGLYALAAQVNPDITPDIFWTTARDTASQLSVHIDTPETVSNSLLGEPYTLTHVVNPGALIDALKEN